ncbi:hypothetical protein BH23ACT9_BH23ACT9_37830 [soil metagenome]
MARAFHEGREINLALDTARQSLEDAGGDVQPLVAAYTRHQREDLLIEDLAMLANLGRWLDNADLAQSVRVQAYQQGLHWCGTTDGRERERRIDTLRRRFDDALANDVDLALF